MGMIRKTMSVATLGLVNWRSTSELLEAESGARKDAEDKLTDTSAALEKASRRARKAQKRAEKAELAQLAQAKKAKRSRWFRRRKHETLETVAEAKGASKTMGRMAKRRLKKAAKEAPLV